MPEKKSLRVLKNLAYLTQLGISVVVPILLCIFLAGWLRQKFGWGSWVMVVGILLGVFSGIYNFFRFLTFILAQAKKGEKKHRE